MSEVVIRCPNCGTTQGVLGECEACHDAEVRYFCTNHSPGRWLDGPACEECGARFGVDRVRPRPAPRPAPASGSRPRAEPPPTLGSRAPAYDEPERTVDDAWTGPVHTPRGGTVEEIGGPGPGVEWPPATPFPPIGVRVVSMGGCVRRLVILFLVLLALAALAFFGVLGIASQLLFGAGPDMRPVPERVDVAGPEGPLPIG